MSITKNIRGAWVVSDIVRGYIISRQFYYCTKREALRLFREEMKKQ